MLEAGMMSNRSIHAEKAYGRRGPEDKENLCKQNRSPLIRIMVMANSQAPGDHAGIFSTAIVPPSVIAVNSFTAAVV